ncbi:MAG: ORF6N domain-containing protein [Arcobacteraceae bacterium]|nr:ORF6N domain-containing protein [Arcobacteraceae bacterium]
MLDRDLAELYGIVTS